VPYEVQTEVFAGPFDLLLHLILREEVELYDISLSTIVDAYLAELERLEDLDLELATEFLLIAATLVELKTRRLLPGENDLDLDDELALWEERDLLLSRLVECKTFKDASRALQQYVADASRSYPRTAGIEDRFVDLTPDILAGVTVDDLHRAFLDATRPRVEAHIDLDHVAPIRASVTDAVEELVRELRVSRRVTFRELTEHCLERLEIVVRFLAVLELYKQGLVDITQFTTFGEIEVVWAPDEAEAGSPLAVDFAVVDAYDG
jgi:segregation and condensation protein A